MKEKNVLDADYANAAQKNVKEYRIPAILLEGIFLFLTFIGLVYGPDSLLIIGACSLAMVYMAASWYLFKAEKFRGWDMALSIPGGLIANTGIMGLLFKALQWEGAAEMILIYFMTGGFGIIATLIWYLVRRKNKLEYRLSLKLLSRFGLFLLVILLL